jgi:hypothetical protein
MCGATESLDLALAGATSTSPAAGGRLAADADADGRCSGRAPSPSGMRASSRPFVNALSDVDGHQVNVPGRRSRLGSVHALRFSAKFDPVATMLVQDHRTVITTSTA